MGFNEGGAEESGKKTSVVEVWLDRLIRAKEDRYS